MANFTEARVGTIDPSRALVLASILQNHKPVDYGIPAGICPTMDLSPKANETESSGRYCEVDLFKAKYYTTGTVIKKVNNFICYDPDFGRVYPVRGMVKAGTICKDLENYCQPVTIAKNIHGLEDGTRGPGGKVFVDTSVSINETTGYEVEGLASYHFNSKPYVSYENTNIINIVTGKIQAQGPLYSIFTDFYAKVSEFKTDLMKNSFRKYFENWRYVAADRKFYGTIQWREDIYYDYEYEMVFDSKFEKIESGKAKVFDNQKRLLNTVYFGNSGSSGGLKYKAISSRMTCICNQENCSWKLSGCKNEPNNDPSSNYYWGNSWVPGPYETQKANLARAKDEFGLCKAKSAKGTIFLGYTKRYNGHNLAAKDKLYCQSASSEGCEETTFNFKGLLLKENNELIRWLDYQTALNSTLVKLKSVLGFCQSWISPFPGEIKSITRTRVICDIQGELYHQNLKSAKEVDDVNIEILIEANWIHESVARGMQDDVMIEASKSANAEIFPVVITTLLFIIAVFVLLVLFVLVAFCKYRMSFSSSKKVDDIKNSDKQSLTSARKHTKTPVVPIPPARHTVLGIADAQI